MAEIFDVTSWNEKSYFSTGGSRDKSFLESPDEQLYFFKSSLNKPGKDYKFEFWSEIIASEIGKHLKLDILKYDIALKEKKIGCICKSMINSEKERLTEGVNYLVGFDNNYDPSSKDHQTMYSYQRIKQALKFFNLSQFIENIDELIVFDSLIGNSDRHQENWATISKYSELSKAYGDIINNEPDSFFKRGAKKFLNYASGNKNMNVTSTLLFGQTVLDEDVRFAPIYDSGSSLAREHSDDTLKSILNDKVRLEAYIAKGKAEIHWNGEKLRHFDLISQLTSQSEKARETINNFTKLFNEEVVSSIIYNIDKDVPSDLNEFKLSPLRKDFLTKMITLRYQKLSNL